MNVPAIPYVTLPELVVLPARTLGEFPAEPLSLKPFGILVALGVYVGAYLAVLQGKRRGLSERALMSFSLWVLGMGFLGGHMLDVLFYYPGQVLEDPLSLFRLWDGLSSFGGFTGALAGGLVWRLRHGVPILPYADTLSSAFPIGWVFGRAGCTVVHDHPGMRSEHWLAMAYPDGGRFDLGFLELLITLPLALSFVWCWRRPRPWGFYTAAMCLYYAPLRFALDFLRVRPEDAAGLSGAIDPRYGPFTPAQWASIALFGLGVALAIRVAKGGHSGYRAPRVPAPFDGGLDERA